MTEFAKYFGKSPTGSVPTNFEPIKPTCSKSAADTRQRDQPGSGATLLFRQDAQASAVPRVLAVPPGPTPTAQRRQEQ
jgi:hypothetical protein